MSAQLVASDRAPGLLVAPGLEIPDDTQIAPYVTIYAGVDLGVRVELEQGAIVGRPQQIDERSRSPLLPPGAATTIGDGARVGSGTVVVAGARIGRDTYLSDLVLIRESAVLGDEVMIGRGCSVTHDVVVGHRVRIQNDTLVGPWTVIEDDVFVSPRVTFIGDPTMGRKALGMRTAGILVRRASRIGTAAIVMPPVEIGEESVVAAASLVLRDVPSRTVVAGTPAQWLRDVRDDELLERWSD
jgi:UDP-2-acetamido-3-amino-2,3-dideoxy-glucuronate N-acetyltransferase